MSSYSRRVCPARVWSRSPWSARDPSGGTESTTTATIDTDMIASDARVVVFDVGELRCGGAVTAPVDVTWATEGATGVAIAVDNITPPGLAPRERQPCSCRATTTPMGFHHSAGR